jgi:two-component SAPR family response regulator
MQIETRTLKLEDYDELVEIMKLAYPKMSEYVWSKKVLQAYQDFSTGQICITVDGNWQQSLFQLL